MHEFLLFSQVPVTRHDQVLHILAGVCASQPTKLTEQHLIYRQTRLLDAGTSKKGGPPKQQSAQAQRPSYHKLIREVDLATRQQLGPWTGRAEELPQAGVSVAVSRSVDERTMDESELERFREGGQWYKYDSIRTRPSRLEHC